MHSLFVFGLNYETSGFEIREKLAFSRDKISFALTRLQDSGVTREAFILSTCNRTEIYCITHDIDFVINSICDMQNVCPRTVRKHSYVYSDSECVRHLFRVVSGLESMVLGETEIVAQTKEAVQIAQAHKSISTELLGIFHMALALEKDVRSLTSINDIAISMGSALVNLVAVHMDDLHKSQILFIGAGSMMNQIAPHFKSIKCKQKTVINRTISKASELATRILADAKPLNQIGELINDYSVIIVCSNSDKPLVDAKLLEAKLDRGDKILIIDISMPLVTDLALRRYPQLTLLTIDDIAKIVDVGVARRKVAASDADVIIDAKLIEYQAWRKKRGLTPIIKALRDNAESSRVDLVNLAQKQLQNGEDVEIVLNNLSNKLMNKLLHSPTVNLCAIEGRLQDDLVELVSLLYDLEVS